MQPSHRHTDEVQRLEALRRYHLLDTIPEPRLDDLTALAGHICNTPMAVISLVDEHRQWFKSKIGLSICETPRAISFCAHAILQPDIFILPDTALDARFADNPLVTGDPHIRFYAGAPLVTEDGQALGTLCVMDHVPRELTPSQQEGLRVLSRQVMAQVELRSQTRELVTSVARLRIVTDNAHVGLVIVNLERRYVYANATYAEILGLPSPAIVGLRVADVMAGRYEEQIGPRLDRAFAGERVAGELRKPSVHGESCYSVRYEPTEVDGAIALVVIVMTDITDRKRSEEEIRRSSEISARAEQEFRALFAANPLPMWIYDLTTLRFLEVNGAAVERYGYTRDAFLAMTIKDIRPPEDVERLVGNLQEPREPWQGTGSWRHRLKSGRIIDVDITSHTIAFAGQSAVLVVAQDITERTRAEEAQRASEARYRTLFEYAPDGIVIADQESNYIDANPSICRMLGYTREGLVGLHASDIVVKSEIEHIGSALRMITGQSEYHREWQFRRKDGTVFAADVIATLMPDGHLLGMIRDVTERNQAVEALRTTEERMRFVLQSAGVGIWDMDCTTGVVRWSETSEAQYGLQPGTFGGTFEAFVACVHPDDRASLLETVGKAMATGSDFSVQHRSIWRDGTVRWLSGAGRIHLGAHGEPVRGVGISLDVTERHTLEEQYQQAQKMEAIGRLAGGVAHDFNNLLTVILGNCELLLADTPLDDPRQADLVEIQNAGTSGAALTRQLLAFSRKQIIEPTRLDLNVVVSEMRAMLGRLIGEDVAVVVRLGPDLAPVMADRGQVEQIVMNLAVNARDAMPDGGTLTIATANAELDEHYAATHIAVQPGPYVELTVSDTGGGMTPEVQARLFEPFFTTKEVGRGTGLGLATVHGIVMRSGGTINLHSEVGKGTRLQVYFPRADASQPAVAAPPPANRPRAGTETVLVVEDADGLRELTRKLLQRQGYTVMVAADAHEALRIFESSASIDVVLTDVVMPGVSGPELTRRLLEQRPALKVIYMSGYTEDAIVHRGILNPGIAFLHKPFTSDALGRKIREALDR